MRVRAVVAIVAGLVAAGAGAPAADAGPPAPRTARALITAHPQPQTQDAGAVFTFKSSGGLAILPSFACRLDGGAWQACESPHRTGILAPGRHALEVRLDGLLADGTPDGWTWEIVAAPVVAPCAKGCTAVAPPRKPEPKPRPRPKPKRTTPPKPARTRRRAPSTRPTACRDAASLIGAASVARLARATACLVNRERAQRRLRRVVVVAPLTRAALAHTRDMVARRYFAHVSPDGRRVGQRISAAGYLRGAGWWEVGEVLAWSGAPPATPQRIVRAWLGSPRHRAIVLDPDFREIGVGVTRGVPGNGRFGRAATYAAVLGRRLSRRPS